MVPSRISLIERNIFSNVVDLDTYVMKCNDFVYKIIQSELSSFHCTYLSSLPGKFYNVAQDLIT